MLCCKIQDFFCLVSKNIKIVSKVLLVVKKLVLKCHAAPPGLENKQYFFE
jgi:hypothetical protein